jgi:hypothetical protein
MTKYDQWIDNQSDDAAWYYGEGFSEHCDDIREKYQQFVNEED